MISYNKRTNAEAELSQDLIDILAEELKKEEDEELRKISIEIMRPGSRIFVKCKFPDPKIPNFFLYFETFLFDYTKGFLIEGSRVKTPIEDLYVQPEPPLLNFLKRVNERTLIPRFIFKKTLEEG